MDSVELEDRVRLLVEAAGLRLLGALWKPQKGRPLLRVVADAEEHNITINECARLSRLISDLLDTYPHDFPDYRLEVSSPGLNHPLERWQFQKNLGHTVDVLFQEKGTPQKDRGELVEITEQGFTLRQREATRFFPFTEIQQVLVVPKWSPRNK